MTYEVFEDHDVPGQWRVEGFNVKSGDVAVTIFAGEFSKERAYQYFHFLTDEVAQ